MRTQIGVSLFEVIISLLILSLMLLGFDAMHIVALRATEAAYFFAVATQQVNNLNERLQVSHTVDYQFLERWNKQIKHVLPRGRGVLEGYYPNVRISIFWGEMSTDYCKDSKMGQRGCIVMDFH